MPRCSARMRSSRSSSRLMMPSRWNLRAAARKERSRAACPCANPLRRPLRVRLPSSFERPLDRPGGDEERARDEAAHEQAILRGEEVLRENLRDDEEGGEAHRDHGAPARAHPRRVDRIQGVAGEGDDEHAERGDARDAARPDVFRRELRSQEQGERHGGRDDGESRPWASSAAVDGPRGEDVERDERWRRERDGEREDEETQLDERKPNVRVAHEEERGAGGEPRVAGARASPGAQGPDDGERAEQEVTEVLRHVGEPVDEQVGLRRAGWHEPSRIAPARSAATPPTSPGKTAASASAASRFRSARARSARRAPIAPRS